MFSVRLSLCCEGRDQGRSRKSDRSAVRFQSSSDARALVLLLLFTWRAFRLFGATRRGVMSWWWSFLVIPDDGHHRRHEMQVRTLPLMHQNAGNRDGGGYWGQQCFRTLPASYVVATPEQRCFEIVSLNQLLRTLPTIQNGVF